MEFFFWGSVRTLPPSPAHPSRDTYDTQSPTPLAAWQCQGRHKRQLDAGLIDLGLSIPAPVNDSTCQ